MAVRIVLIVVAALVIAAVAALFVGQRRWAASTAGLERALENARRPLPVARVDFRELETLPPVVQRFFRAALTDGMPVVHALEIEHRGTFDMAAEGAAQWKPFTSHQRVVTQRPGFVWDGRVALLPGLTVHVHDAYVAGEGVLHPAIAGLVSLAEMRGTGEIARGELMRFFAEASWYPTALLPSQGVRWRGLDDRRAEATMSDGPIAITLAFTFGADGLIESVRAESRGRTVGDRVVATPWEGRWSGYVQRDGMRVPGSGEVAWLTPEGPRPYWRGEVTALRYGFAR